MARSSGVHVRGRKLGTAMVPIGGMVMFVVYMWCKASDEGDAAGFTIATDDAWELTELDYSNLRATECLWIVPGTAL